MCIQSQSQQLTNWYAATLIIYFHHTLKHPPPPPLLTAQPIDYFELVLHPQSFGHTIENIFHLSFLDKDGLIRIYIGEHGLPLVEPVNQQQREGSGGQQQASRPGDNKQQMIVSMTPREWTDLVNVFGLRGKAPMIVPTVVQEEET